MLKVPPKWVHGLPMDTPIVIPDTGGVQVTLIEANHCPGSCLFMFEGRQTVNAGDSTYKSAYVGSTKIFRYLHCGDFRASPAHVHHPAVKGKKIDAIYLDTTYLDPKVSCTLYRSSGQHSIMILVYFSTSAPGDIGMCRAGSTIGGRTVITRRAERHSNVDEIEGVWW
jgi:hypothetical protein